MNSLHRFRCALAGILGAMCLLTASVTASGASQVLALPPVLYAVSGQELNLFFDSVILAPPGRHYIVKITCPKGKQQSERWVLRPADADIGEFPLAVELRDLDDRVVATAQTKVLVSSASRLGDRAISLLAVGDSLTAAGIYTNELLKLFEASPQINFTLMGTHHTSGPPHNLHEGYGGWKYEDFLSRFDLAGEKPGARRATSPFVFNVDGKPVFDPGRYFRESAGGKLPSAITIFLGTNDVFAAKDQDREAVIRKVSAQATMLVDRLHAAAPGARIGILAPLAPAGQDAFGENYGSEYDAWSYRKNQMALLEALMTAFSGREAEGIYFVPSYVNFDPATDYPVAVGAPRNARNNEMLSRQSNAVHPSGIGYQHVADAVFAWLVNAFANSPNQP